jgi:hypothetical protein
MENVKIYPFKEKLQQIMEAIQNELDHYAILKNEKM